MQGPDCDIYGAGQWARCDLSSEYGLCRLRDPSKLRALEKRSPLTIWTRFWAFSKYSRGRLLHHLRARAVLGHAQCTQISRGKACFFHQSITRVRAAKPHSPALAKEENSLVIRSILPPFNYAIALKRSLRCQTWPWAFWSYLTCLVFS